MTNNAADDDRSDINADGLVDFGDLSAAFSFIPSTKPAKPDSHVCTLPSGACTSGGSGESSASSGDDSDESPTSSGHVVSTQEATEQLIDGFVNFLATVSVPNAAVNEFKQLVDEMVNWAVDHLSRDERKTLADKLQDPSLTFTSPLIADMVPDIVAALRR